MDSRWKTVGFRAGCVVWVVLALVVWGFGIAGLVERRNGPPAAFQADGSVDLDHAVAEDLWIDRIAFGVFEELPRGSFDAPRLAILTTDLVPNQPGQRFGWVAWVETSRSEIRLREVFEAPPPGNWGEFSEDVVATVSEDGRVLTLERDVAPSHGQVFSVLVAEEGDPSGAYRFELFVEDVSVAEWSFRVE